MPASNLTVKNGKPFGTSKSGQINRRWFCVEHLKVRVVMHTKFILFIGILGCCELWESYYTATSSWDGCKVSTATYITIPGFQKSALSHMPLEQLAKNFHNPVTFPTIQTQHVAKSHLIWILWTTRFGISSTERLIIPSTIWRTPWKSPWI